MGNVYNAGRDNNVVIVGQERPKIGFFGIFGLLLLVGFLVKHIAVVLAILVILGVLSAVYMVVKEFADGDEIEDPIKAVARRADEQHQAILNGDMQTGVHGDYPPAV